MARALILVIVLVAPFVAHPQNITAPNEQEPPEEDQSFKPRVYDFNPLKAAKSVEIGDEYFKKGNYAAAKGRYQDATRYDPGSSQAFAKLCSADERLHDLAAARAACTKYLELEPAAKDAAAIKRRIEKWPVAPEAPKH